MKIIEGINEYIESGRSIGRSGRWVKIRRGDLEIYMRWQMVVHGIEDVRYVTERDMREYLIFLQKDYRPGKPLAVITVRHCFMSVKSYFEWLQRRGLILSNPCRRIVAPKSELNVPRVLNETDIERLVESPDTATALGIRDRALMELLYGTGIRHLECWKLNIYDVDVINRQLTVRLGKWGKDRIVPMTKQASTWLGKYIAQARRELVGGGGKSKKRLSSTPGLWISRDGNRLSYGRLEAVIKGYARKLEIEVSVHMFRHTYATHLLRGGADIRHIQKLLGHADIQSTTIYTHLEISDLQKEIRKLGRNR